MKNRVNRLKNITFLMLLVLGVLFACTLTITSTKFAPVLARMEEVLVLGDEDLSGTGFNYDSASNTLVLTNYNGTALSFLNPNAKLVLSGRNSLLLNTNNDLKTGGKSAIAVYAHHDIQISGEGILIIDMDMQANDTEDFTQDTTDWLIGGIYAETGVKVTEKVDLRMTISSENTPATGICTNAGEIVLTQDYLDNTPYLPDGVSWEEQNYITLNGDQNHIAVWNKAKDDSITNNGDITLCLTNGALFSIYMPSNGIGILSDDGQDESDPTIFHNTDGTISLLQNQDEEIDPYWEFYLSDFKQGIINKSQQRSTAQPDIILNPSYTDTYSDVEDSVAIISKNNGVQIKYWSGDNYTDGTYVDLSSSNSLYGLKVEGYANFVSNNDYVVKMNSNHSEGIAVIDIAIPEEDQVRFTTNSEDEAIKQKVVDGYVRWGSSHESITLYYAQIGVICPTIPNAYSMYSEFGEAYFRQKPGFSFSSKQITIYQYGQEVKVDLYADGFYFADNITGGWITNLPAGYTATYTRTGDSSAQIAISFSGDIAEPFKLEISIPKADTKGYYGEDITTTETAIVTTKEISFVSVNPTKRIECGNDMNVNYSFYVDVNGVTFSSLASNIEIVNVPAGLTVQVIKTTYSARRIVINVMGKTTETESWIENVRLKIPVSAVEGYAGDEEYLYATLENKIYLNSRRNISVESPLADKETFGSGNTFRKDAYFYFGDSVFLNVNIGRIDTYLEGLYYFYNDNPTEKINIPFNSPQGSNTISFTPERDAEITISITIKYIRYEISKDTIVGGTVDFDVSQQKKGGEVNLNITPKAGYTFKEAYYYVGEEKFVISDNKFTMPGSDVVVGAEFEPITYTVSAQGDENGTVKVDKTTASVEDWVSVSFDNITAGFRLSKLYYKIEGDETEYQISRLDNGFQMPAGNVTVYGEFYTPIYKITKVTATDEYVVTLNTTDAVYSETVHILNDFAKDGLYITNVRLIKEDNTFVDLGAVDSFQMLDSNISVEITLAKIDYNLARVETNGTFTLPSTANKGDNITITNISPKHYYSNAVKEAYYVDSTGNRTEIDKTTLSFVMPNDNITVYVVFEEKTITLVVPENSIIKIIGRFDDDNKYTAYDEPILLTAGEHIIKYYELVAFYNSPEENIEFAYCDKHGNEIPCGAEKEGSKLFDLNSSNRIEITVEVHVIKYKLSIKEGEGYNIVVKDKYNNEYFDGDWVSRSFDLTVEITPLVGYELVQVLLNDALFEQVDGKYTFNMNAQDNTLEIQTERKSYSIVFPAEVTVVRGNETLTGDSVIYYGDILKITYPTAGYYETIVEVNGSEMVSGSTITVDGNVNITFSQTQIMFQLWFTNTADYIVRVLNGSTPVIRGSWVSVNTELTIQIIPTTGRRIFATKLNGVVTDLTTTYLMPLHDVTITADTEMIDYNLSKGPEVNGTFDINKTIANYEDDITLTVNPEIGYRVSKMYYKVEGSDAEVLINSTFSMPANNITVYVEFEKIEYTIDIDENVVVKRNGVILTNSDKVYYGDELEITFATPAHFETLVKVNGQTKNSGDKFVVGAGDVVVTYEETQVEGQINFADGENYSIEVKNGETTLSSGDWVRKGTELQLIIRVNEGCMVISTKFNGQNVTLADGKFTVGVNSLNIDVEIEKIAYNLDIDENVVIKRNGVVLTNSDKVYYGDELEITFVTPAHFETLVKVNGQTKNSGDKFVVGAGDVVVTYEETQVEGQINFADGENYSIEVKNGDVTLSSGDWVRKGTELQLIIQVNEGYMIISTKFNGQGVTLTENKFTLTENILNITVEVAEKEITITDEAGIVSVVGDRDLLEDCRLEVIIIEDHHEDFSQIKSQLKNAKTIKAFSVKLINKTTGEEVVLDKNVKVILQIPSDLNLSKIKLFRVLEDGAERISYEKISVGDKNCSVILSNTLGKFAFVEEKEQTGSNGLMIIMLAGIVLAGIIGGIIVIYSKNKKEQQ